MRASLLIPFTLGLSMSLACSSGRRDSDDSDDVVPDGGSQADAGQPPTCDADLQTSADHCGACNHSCLGGTCDGGRCAPFRLVDGVPTLSIVVTADSIFVADADNGRVWRVAKTGGEAEERGWASGAVVPAAANATHLFLGVRGRSYPTQGRIERVPLAGGAEPEELATWQLQPMGLFVDEAAVYWTNLGSGGALSPYNPGSLWMKRHDGGEAEAIVENLARPGQLASDGAALYWPNHGADPANAKDGTIMRLAFGGDYLETLATGQHGPRQLAVDGEHVWWTNEGTSNDSNRDGAVMRVTKDGSGQPERIASAREPGGIVVDATHVYWTEDAFVKRRAKSGGAVETLASVDAEGLQAGALAQDEAAIYFGVSGMYLSEGGVFKVAK